MRLTSKFSRVALLACTFVACVFAFQNCGYIGSSDPGAFALSSQWVTFGEVNAKVFQPKCNACHSGSNPQGNVDLSTYSGAMAVTIPFEVSASLLMSEIDTGSMPPSGGLTQEEVNLVANWILSGAPDTYAPMPTPGPTPTPAPTAAPTATPTPSGTPTATYAYISANILTPKCVGCHGVVASGGYRYNSYAETLASVVPGNAAASALYNSVADDSMPKNAVPLSAQEKALIQMWINNGAQNN